MKRFAIILYLLSCVPMVIIACYFPVVMGFGMIKGWIDSPKSPEYAWLGKYSNDVLSVRTASQRPLFDFGFSVERYTFSADTVDSVFLGFCGTYIGDSPDFADTALAQLPEMFDDAPVTRHEKITRRQSRMSNVYNVFVQRIDSPVIYIIQIPERAP